MTSEMLGFANMTWQPVSIPREPGENIISPEIEYRTTGAPQTPPVIIEEKTPLPWWIVIVGAGLAYFTTR